MKSPEKTKSRESRRLVPVDLSKIQQRFLIVLKREAAALLDESFEKKLSKESSLSLVNYLKLLKEVKESEEEELEKMTDEELEMRMSINNKKGDKNAWK